MRSFVSCTLELGHAAHTHCCRLRPNIMTAPLRGFLRSRLFYSVGRDLKSARVQVTKLRVMRFLNLRPIFISHSLLSHSLLYSLLPLPCLHTLLYGPSIFRSTLLSSAPRIYSDSPLAPPSSRKFPSALPVALVNPSCHTLALRFLAPSVAPPSTLHKLATARPFRTNKVPADPGAAVARSLARWLFRLFLGERNGKKAFESMACLEVPCKSIEVPVVTRGTEKTLSRERVL